MLIAILGRQPKLSLAELEAYFGSQAIETFSPQAALIKRDVANIDHLGGTLKIAHVDLEIRAKNPLEVLRQIEKHYIKNLPSELGKLTLGISWYGPEIAPKLLNRTLIKIKARLKKTLSLRLLPLATMTLSTATAHHNGLGKSPKKIEIIVVQNHQDFLVGHSIGCQNISAYRDRDQKRPKRDAKVGMLPPKLAQIIVNLARQQPYSPNSALALLDPFCGTGVLLQEAHLMGFQVLGSDLEARMINFTRQNLAWLDENLNQRPLLIGDATKLNWPKFDIVASESYLGRAFGTPPSISQIIEEKSFVGNLIKGFLRNLHSQLANHGQICLAVPAWLRPDGRYEDLDLVNPEVLAKLGFKMKKFRWVANQDLIYFRPEQSVARRLLVLQKIAKAKSQI